MPGPAYAEVTPVDWLTRLANLENNSLTGAPIIDQLILGGRVLFTALATPSAPVVASTPTTGATTQTYLIVARLGTGNSSAGATGSTAVGPSTLSASAFNTITWNAVANATSYDVYRTVGGAAQGKIANVPAPLTSLVDNALVADGTTAPTLNSSAFVGGIVVQDQTTVYSASGAITNFGFAPITKAGVAALTLTQPKAGAPSAGGEDGATLTLVDTGGHAHTVTTGTNGFNGAHSVATFGGTVGQFGTLKAYNGTWYVTASAGFTLSA